MRFNTNEIKSVVNIVLEASLMQASDEEMPKILQLVQSEFKKQHFDTKYEDNDTNANNKLLDLITTVVNKIVAHHAFPSDLKFKRNEKNISDDIVSSYLSPENISVEKIPHPMLKEVHYKNLNGLFDGYERKDLVFNLKDYLGPNYLYTSVAENEGEVSKLNISIVEKHLRYIFTDIKKIITYYRIKNKVPDDINIYYPIVSVFKHIPEGEHLNIHKIGKAISFSIADMDPFEIVTDIEKEKIDVTPGVFGVVDGLVLYGIPYVIKLNGEEQLIRNMTIDQSYDINFIV